MISFKNLFFFFFHLREHQKGNFDWLDSMLTSKCVSFVSEKYDVDSFSSPANKTVYFITTIKWLKCHDKRNPGVRKAHKNESLKHPQHRHNINTHAHIDGDEENLSDFIIFSSFV